MNPYFVIGVSIGLVIIVILIVGLVLLVRLYSEIGKAMEEADNLGDECPICGAPEISANSPRTYYACGSSDYDQRPGTFRGNCDPTTNIT